MDVRAREIEAVYRDRYVGFRNALAGVTGSHESARDVVQEAFARALRDRAKYRGEGPLAAWIFRIALRLAFQTASAERNVSLDDAADVELVEPDADPELADALRNLPPRRRLIVFLRYFADMSYAEIAAACQVSEGTVAAALAQSRAVLLAALEREEVPR